MDFSVFNRNNINYDNDDQNNEINEESTYNYLEDYMPSEMINLALQFHQQDHNAHEMMELNDMGHNNNQNNFNNNNQNNLNNNNQNKNNNNNQNNFNNNNQNNYNNNNQNNYNNNNQNNYNNNNQNNFQNIDPYDFQENNNKNNNQNNFQNIDPYDFQENNYNNNNQNNFQNIDPYDFQENNNKNNDNFDINDFLLNEEQTIKIEIEDILENLYVEAQNKKNYNEKIKIYEQIIDTEKTHYQTKIWTYKSYEQLVYIYCQSLERENVIESLKKLIELREEVDDSYSIPVMQNIILILQNPDIIQLSRPVVSAVVKVLHESNGNKDYYTQLLTFLQSTKLFFMEDESQAKFPINLLIPYINDISVFNLEVHVIGNEEQPKTIGGQHYTPPIGWTSYEFDIYHHYDNGDETWLKCDGNIGEWAIAYHGTARAINQNNKILEIVENIYKTNLKPGVNQACAHHPNINLNTKLKYKVCGRGVYLTPNITVAESYSAILKINGKQYSVVLQFKVNPNTLRISNTYRDYWICDGNVDSVRPYRLLIREFKKNN